jgi:hypothetical protein
MFREKIAAVLLTSVPTRVLSPLAGERQQSRGERHTPGEERRRRHDAGVDTHVAQGGAQRALEAASGRLGQRQVGEVGAGDQRQDAHRGAQDQERRPLGSELGVAQRHGARAPAAVRARRLLHQDRHARGDLGA